MGFVDIVMGGNFISQLIWLLIFLLPVVGLVLGVFSIVGSVRRKKRSLPKSFRLLCIFSVLFLFVGFTGTLSNAVEITNVIDLGSGAAKAGALARIISGFLWQITFTFLGLIPYLFFVTISVILMHFNKLSESVQGGE